MQSRNPRQAVMVCVPVHCVACKMKLVSRTGWVGAITLLKQSLCVWAADSYAECVEFLLLFDFSDTIWSRRI